MLDPEWLEIPLPKTILVFLLVEILGGILIYYFFSVSWPHMRGRTSISIFQSRMGNFLLRKASFYWFRVFALWVMMYAFLNLLDVASGIAFSSYMYFYASDFVNGELAVYCFFASLFITSLMGPKGMVVPVTPDLTVSMDEVGRISFHIRSLKPDVDVELYSDKVSKAIEMFDGWGVESEYSCVTWLFVPNQKRRDKTVVALRDEFRAVPGWLREIIKLVPGATYCVRAVRKYVFATSDCVKHRLAARLYILARCTFIFSTYFVLFRFVRVWLLVRNVPSLSKVSQSGVCSAKFVSSVTSRCHKLVLPNRMRVMTFLSLSMRMPHLVSQIGGLEAGYIIRERCDAYKSVEPGCRLAK